MNPHVIQVIEYEELRGKGTTGDPIRRVTCYCKLDGVLLAERDSVLPEDLSPEARKQLAEDWKQRFMWGKS